MAFSPDGRLLASGGNDRCVIFWNMPEGRPRAPCRASDFVHAIAFLSDGRTLASTGQRAIQFWDTATGRHRADWPTPNYHAKALAATGDGRWLATSGHPSHADNAARLWDVATGHQLLTLSGH